MNKGRIVCTVNGNGVSNKKTYFADRFVWECFSGLISDGKVIFHVNRDRIDNRLCMTHHQVGKEITKDVDFSSTNKYKYQNVRCVKAVNCTTNEIAYYSSMYAVQKHLGVYTSNVKKFCDKIPYHKTGISKTDGYSYRFEYLKKRIYLLII